MTWLFPWTTSIETPIGWFVVEGHAGVRSARFLDEPVPDEGPDPLGLRAKVDRYFAGQVHALEEVPLELEGTPYQQRVWARVRSIPVGRTRSYGAIAEELDSVARAVGRANATNPAALFVPCHRVVGSHEELTGYAYGVERKQFLLDLERGLLELPLG